MHIVIQLAAFVLLAVVVAWVCLLRVAQRICREQGHHWAEDYNGMFCRRCGKPARW